MMKKKTNDEEKREEKKKARESPTIEKSEKDCQTEEFKAPQA